MSIDIDFTGKLLPNDGQNPTYMSSYPTGNAPTGTQHGARYVVNATGLQVASFGTKAAQAPAIWEQFKNGTEGQLLAAYDSTWNAYASHNGGKITANNPRYVGSKSAYKDSSMQEFDTNYKKYSQTDSVFASYWIYLSGDSVADYVQYKTSRTTSDTDAGGGGVYNDVGSLGTSRFIPDQFTSYWSGAGQGGNLYDDGIMPQLNQWYKIVTIAKQGTQGAANGLFITKTLSQSGNGGKSVTNADWLVPSTAYAGGNTYNNGDYVGMVKPAGTNSGINHTFRCNTNGTTIAPFDGSGNIQSGWTLAGRENFKFNTHLLGLMQANARIFYTVNTITDNTTYTVTINGTAYPINSGTGATANSIMAALVTAVTNGGVHFAEIKNGQIYAAVSNGAGVTQGVFDSKFTPRYVKTYISDVYVDTSLSRFEVGEDPVYANCKILEPQPYASWNGSQVKFNINAPTISGNKYLFFTDSNNVTYALGLMQSGGVHNA